MKELKDFDYIALDNEYYTLIHQLYSPGCINCHFRDIELKREFVCKLFLKGLKNKNSLQLKKDKVCYIGKYINEKITEPKKLLIAKTGKTIKIELAQSILESVIK